MMSVSLKIAVAESSQIIRSGLLAVLKRLPGLNVSVVEIADPEQLVMPPMESTTVNICS